jgi:hypothetical protein
MFPKQYNVARVGCSTFIKGEENMSKSKMYGVFTVLMIAMLALSACGGAARKRWKCSRGGPAAVKRRVSMP